MISGLKDTETKENFKNQLKPGGIKLSEAS
jgi:hypothetical protein